MDNKSEYIIKLDKDYLFDESFQIVIEDSKSIPTEKLELLYEEFLKIKETSKLLLTDLKRIRGRFCDKSQRIIYSIKTLEFELDDILKYTSSSINDGYVSHLKNLKYLLKCSDFKGYLDSIPGDSKVYNFLEFTRKPKRGTLLYNYRNGRELWELEDKKYWEFVRFLWKECSENVFSIRHLWLELFTCDRENKQYFMNSEERTFLENLPEEFEVYRGYSNSKPTEKMKPENLKFWGFNWFGDMGFSYTLSREVGMKYSDKYKIYNREFSDTDYYKMENDLYQGLVKKSDVLFYFNGNNEEEIIIVKKHGRYVF
jgi:hypothetical protein